MHKELNAFKGGNTRMMAFWVAEGLEPPILLMNRDNDAAASAGNSAAQTRAIEQSRGGGSKLVYLPSQGRQEFERSARLSAVLLRGL